MLGNFKFHRCKLGDLVTFQRGKDLPRTSMIPGPYPVLGSNGIIGYHNQYISEGPVIVIGRSGNVGKPFMVDGRAWPHNTSLYIKEFKNCDPSFIYYLLKTLNLANVAGGSAVPTLNRNHVHPLEVIVPTDISIQRKIGEVLKTYDKKISLNNHINDNLLQQLRTLYKAWFIDCLPFGNQVPSDWREGRLSDVLKLTKNSTKKEKRPDLLYLPIDVIPMNDFALTEMRPNSEAQSSLITFDKDDILIGAMRVYFHRVLPAPCAGITRSTCFVLKAISNEYFSFALLTCDLDDCINFAQSRSKGSTMPYAIWEGGLGDYPINIPSTQVLKEFNQRTKPLIEKIQNSYFENKNLMELRDSLLPKLLSGEIKLG